MKRAAYMSHELASILRPFVDEGLEEAYTSKEYV